MATGQAAGSAMALAAKNGWAPRHFIEDTAPLQDLLMQQGAYLEPKAE